MQNESATTSNYATAEISDHQLLDLYISNRTPGAFLELVRRHSGLVYGTCLRITGNPQDAEDLTQECFFDLVRHAGQIRTSLAGWLHKAATNLAFNLLRGERRRKNRERDAGEQVYLTAEQPSGEVTWNEIEPQIDQVLSEIPEHLRIPILLHYLEGATQSDIANDLGVHQSTVSRRLADGLDFLRERLRDAGLVIPATILLTWLTSQTAVAAPSSLSSSLGKVALVGFGTAKASGTSQIAWLTGAAKGLMATFLLPVAAGIVWGELVCLLILALCCGYLGSFETLGLISVFHVGFFTKNLLAAPMLSSPPMFARAPLMDVLPDHFVFSTSPRPTEIVSGAARSSYMGKVLHTSVRVASASTVILQYADQSAVLNIANDATGRMAATGVIAMIQIMPREFQQSIPQSLNINLVLIDVLGRRNKVEGVELAVPSQLTPVEWRSQFELLELVSEQSILLGELVKLGTVLGKSLTLRVLSMGSEF